MSRGDEANSPPSQGAYLFLALELLQKSLKLFLFFYGLSLRRLILLIVSHSHHGQDEVDEVKGTQEDNHHKEQHVGLTRRPQDLYWDQKRNYENLHIKNNFNFQRMSGKEQK